MLFLSVGVYDGEGEQRQYQSRQYVQQGVLFDEQGREADENCQKTGDERKKAAA